MAAGGNFLRTYLALFISFASLVFVAVATGLPNWSKESYPGGRSGFTRWVGVFRVKYDDNNDYLNDVLCTSNGCLQLIKTIQAFAILSNVFGALACTLLALQTFNVMSRRALQNQRLLFMALTLAASIFHFITFILWTQFSTRYLPYSTYYSSVSYDSSFVLVVCAFVLSLVNCGVLARFHHIEDNPPMTCSSACSRDGCRSSMGLVIASLAMLAVGSVMLMVATGIDSWSLVQLQIYSQRLSVDNRVSMGPFVFRGLDGSKQSPSDFCSDSQCYSEMSAVEAFLILSILSSAFTFMSELVFILTGYLRQSSSNLPGRSIYYPKLHGSVALASSGFALIAVMVWYDVSQYLWTGYNSIQRNGVSMSLYVSYTLGAGFIVAVVGLSLMCFAGIGFFLSVPVERALPSRFVDYPMTSQYPNHPQPMIMPGYAPLQSQGGYPLQQTNYHNFPSAHVQSSQEYPAMPVESNNQMVGTSQFCGYCGNPRHPEHRFCSKCGRPVA